MLNDLKAVDFMTAYQALKAGKEVKCLANGMYYTYGKYIHQGYSELCLTDTHGGWVKVSKDCYFESEEIESNWVIVD